MPKIALGIGEDEGGLWGLTSKGSRDSEANLLSCGGWFPNVSGKPIIISWKLIESAHRS